MFDLRTSNARQGGRDGTGGGVAKMEESGWKREGAGRGGTKSGGVGLGARSSFPLLNSSIIL